MEVANHFCLTKKSLAGGSESCAWPFALVEALAPLSGRQLPIPKNRLINAIQNNIKLNYNFCFHTVKCGNIILLFVVKTKTLIRVNISCNFLEFVGEDHIWAASQLSWGVLPVEVTSVQEWLDAAFPVVVFQLVKLTSFQLPWPVAVQVTQHPRHLAFAPSGS